METLDYHYNNYYNILKPPSVVSVRLSTLLDVIRSPNTSPSSSLLRTIHYFNKTEEKARGDEEEEEKEVFPAHTDIGLLTVVPLCDVSLPGLEIVDQETGRWFPVEAHCAAALGREEERTEQEEEKGGVKLLVFGGETLAQATRGWISPARHRVVLQPSLKKAASHFGRISYQLFLRANAQALINTMAGDALCTVAEWERQWEVKNTDAA